MPPKSALNVYANLFAAYYKKIVFFSVLNFSGVFFLKFLAEYFFLPFFLCCVWLKKGVAANHVKSKPFSPVACCNSCIIDCCWHSPSRFLVFCFWEVKRWDAHEISELRLQVWTNEGTKSDNCKSKNALKFKTENLFVLLYFSASCEIKAKFSFSFSNSSFHANWNARHEATLPKTIYVTKLFFFIFYLAQSNLQFNISRCWLSFEKSD